MADKSTSTRTAGKVTLQDVADRCGKALSTVSLALRGDERVKPSTAEEIRAVANDLGYDRARHQSARRMAAWRHGREVVNKIVGGLFPFRGYELPFFGAIVQGLLGRLVPGGFNLTVGGVKQDGFEIDLHTSLEPIMQRGELDGLIFYEAPAHFLSAVEHIRQIPAFADKPIVALLFDFPGTSAVLADEERGASLSASHLLDLGHRHILYLYVEDPERHQPVTAGRRLGGIRSALSKRGLSPARHLHLHPMPIRWVDPPGNEGDIEPEEEAREFIQHIRRNPEVTAVMAQNDPSAIRAWRLLRAAGYSVPEDVSIVGFDDTEGMCDQEGINLLTTVAMPLREIGRRAAQLIMEQISGDGESNRKVVLPVELMIRGSTAPPSRIDA